MPKSLYSLPVSLFLLLCVSELQLRPYQIVPLSLYLYPLPVTRVSTATMKSTYSVYSSSTSSRAPSVSMMRASTGPVYRAATVHGGVTSGSRISLSSASTLRNGIGVGKGIGSGSGGFTSSVQVSGNNAKFMGNEKFAMQNLNERLASYIETVRNLEQANHGLELKITEALQNSGPDIKDYSKQQAILENLRKKVRRG